MKKVFRLALLISLVFAMSSETFALTVVYQINNPDMIVNDTLQSVDESGTTPVIKEGTTLVPLRSAVESIGGYIEWESGEKKITVTMAGTPENTAVLTLTRPSEDEEIKIESVTGNVGIANKFLADLDAYWSSLADKSISEFENAVILHGGSLTVSDDKMIFVISPQSKKVEMWIDKNYAFVNGVRKQLDVPPQLINSKTMVPLRFVSESTGFTAEWEELSRQIFIFDGAEPDNTIDLVTP